MIVEKITQVFKEKKIFILDIGTGTGCILLSIISELKNSKGVGIDISKKAILIAIRNAKRLNLTENTKFYRRSVDEIYHQKFDLIVSNPPYINKIEYNSLEVDVKNYEPKVALNGGVDGYSVIEKVIKKSRVILKNSGLLAIEIGLGQHYKVSELLKNNGFFIIKTIKDYQNIKRCIFSKKIK